MVQGGSTITQQLAKNLFLSFERSLTRKIKEAFLALLLEARYDKYQILKMYLDRAYLGGGAFGVEAASQFYFGKSVRDINLAEAALLGGLFKAPSRYAPHINLPASRARTSEVLSNLVEAGYMSAGQVHAARLNPARVIEPHQSQSPDWFLDWAFEEVQRVAEGRGHYVLTARVTVDLDMQRAAQEALVNTLRAVDTRRGAPFAGALVAMDPDGAVRAIVGGIDYGESQFNRATNARRQPGSSFKIYVYATALENGYNPRSMVRDASGSCGNWSPRNYTGSGGSGRALTMTDAFKVSLNTTAADLSFKVGREKVLEMTQRLGVTGVKRTCSMALGDTGITLLEHTAAYAAFANGGKRAKPYAVLELYNSKGELVYSRERDEPEAPRVVEARVAEQMNQMMHAVVMEGTGRRAILDFTHSAGKTGTSSSWRDAWFVGFTGALVAGVWVGHDDFRPMWLNGNGVTGGTLPDHGVARLHAGGPHQQEHTDHSRAHAAPGAGCRAAAACRVETHRPRHGAGADRAGGRAENLQRHARADARHAAAPRRQHAARHFGRAGPGARQGHDGPEQDDTRIPARSRPEIAARIQEGE